jgi:hypothetical protein
MDSTQLKPQFFVTRQNGAMVPLIAMDELPLHVRIQGVPRTLDPFQIAGMQAAGAADSRHQFYVVESINNTKIITPPSTDSSAVSDKEKIDKSTASTESLLDLEEGTNNPTSNTEVSFLRCS